MKIGGWIEGHIQETGLGGTLRKLGCNYIDVQINRWRKF